MSIRLLHGQPARQELREAVDRDALLLERVAVAQRDGAVLDRLVVDRDRERRADLVLAPVAPADRTAVVVLGLDVAAHVLVDGARELRVAVASAGCRRSTVLRPPPISSSS